MVKLFALDALFLNEDRHTHNISVLMDGNGGFRLCPIYDNGAALMSDLMMDYPPDCNIYEEIGNVKAKTICESFEEQLDIAESMFGKQLRFSFTAKEIEECLQELTIYDTDIRERVKKILLEQRRRYSYMFKGYIIGAD